MTGVGIVAFDHQVDGLVVDVPAVAGGNNDDRKLTL
jgi:hypothetical protein